jgi:hypothetical protein
VIQTNSVAFSPRANYTKVKYFATFSYNFRGSFWTAYWIKNVTTRVKCLTFKQLCGRKRQFVLGEMYGYYHRTYNGMLGVLQQGSSWTTIRYESFVQHWNDSSSLSNTYRSHLDTENRQTYTLCFFWWKRPAAVVGCRRKFPERNNPRHVFHCPSKFARKRGRFPVYRSHPNVLQCGGHLCVREECRLLRYDAVWLLLELVFRRNVSPPSSWRQRVLRLPVTGNLVPSSPNLVTVMMVVMRSSEKSVLTTATRRQIPEDSGSKWPSPTSPALSVSRTWDVGKRLKAATR